MSSCPERKKKKGETKKSQRDRGNLSGGMRKSRNIARRIGKLTRGRRNNFLTNRDKQGQDKSKFFDRLDLSVITNLKKKKERKEKRVTRKSREAYCRCLQNSKSTQSINGLGIYDFQFARSHSRSVCNRTHCVLQTPRCVL